MPTAQVDVEAALRRWLVESLPAPSEQEWARLTASERRRVAELAVSFRNSRVFNGDASGTCDWAALAAAGGREAHGVLVEHLNVEWRACGFSWAPPYEPCGVEQLILGDLTDEAAGALVQLAECGVEKNEAQQLLVAATGLARGGRRNEARHWLTEARALASEDAEGLAVLEAYIEERETAESLFEAWWWKMYFW